MRLLIVEVGMKRSWTIQRQTQPLLDALVPMFSYPGEIRRAIYTTNTIESLNMTLRKVTKNRSLFPSDEAVFKLMYLALRNISKRWTMPIRNWSGALNQFAILFEGRVPMGGLTPNSLTQSAV
jgi:putative transposase